MKIIFSDIDGTLKQGSLPISIHTLNALKLLKKNKIISVLATGRNLISLKSLPIDNSTVDYVIFSTGTGILDLKNKKIIKEFYFSKEKTQEIKQILSKLKLNFFMHPKVSDKQHFYFNYTYPVKDFLDRLKLYESWTKPIEFCHKDFVASQFIIIIKNDHTQFQKLEKEIYKNIDKINIIKATSPLNSSYLWLEIYPYGVSKGTAVKYLCQKLQIPLSEAVAVGNDYNDLTMLEIVGNAYVVANSPEPLLKRFNIIDSCQKNGFVKFVNNLFE